MNEDIVLSILRSHVVVETLTLDHLESPELSNNRLPVTSTYKSASTPEVSVYNGVTVVEH